MKTSEMLKLFKKEKIVLIRHGSSHDIYYSPITQKKISIPRHATEIKTGTANSILKAAGLK